MNPYGSLSSHDEKWCQIDFFDKNEIFGSKRASGQNFRYFAPSYHNVAYKGLDDDTNSDTSEYDLEKNVEFLAFMSQNKAFLHDLVQKQRLHAWPINLNAAKHSYIF